MTSVLTLPGIGNSGPTHWQSQWEARHPGVSRIEQRDWDHPVAADWVATIDDAVRAQPLPPIIVAHSLGCLAAVQWAATSALPLRALMLVALPDPAGPAFPREAAGFDRLPPSLGPREVLVVGSDDDPYAPAGFVAAWTSRWRATHLSLGAAGHINAASGLGDWPQGWDFVRRWRGT